MKYDKLFDSVLIAATLALFVYAVTAYPGALSFSESILWNIIEVPLYLLGSGLVVGAFILIPSIPIYLIIKKIDSMRENGEHNGANTLLIIVCALVVLVLTLLVHSRV